MRFQFFPMFGSSLSHIIVSETQLGYGSFPVTAEWFEFASWPRPEWVKGAVEPIIAMGFARSKCSMVVVGVMGF